MWETIYWFSSAVIVHHFLGYPLVLLGLSHIRRRDKIRSRDITPPVTIVISVYNEEKVIQQKIQNTLALDYPRGQLQIVVASDGSTDRTVDIAREYEREELIVCHFVQRRGKTAVLNDVRSNAQGDVIVFTDANAMFESNAVRELVRPFADPRVGCVCGELIFRSSQNNMVAEGYNRYWRYDQWLKKLESRLHSLLGSNGSIFAVRKELNEPLDPRLSNDMVLPIRIGGRGRAVLYVPQAVSIEAGPAGEKEDLRRRSRVVARGIMGVIDLVPGLLRRHRWLLLFQLFSRKVLRYVFPLLLIILFVSNLFLSGWFYQFTLISQFSLYAFALVGYYLSYCGKRVPFVSVPYYFCISNIAALVGMVKVASLQELATWEGFDRSYDLDANQDGERR